MATTNFCLVSSKQPLNFLSFGDNAQYDNLNLNQSYKCSEIEVLQSSKNVSIFSNNKEKQNYDFTNFNQSKSEFNNKHFTSNSFSLPNQFNDEKIKEQKQWNNDSNTKNNNSTLSLHISAYENANADSNELKQQKSAVRKGKNLQPFRSMIQNPFEFPRQKDDNNNNNKPEIMQFKASQELLDPNKQQQEKKAQSFQNKNVDNYKGLKQVNTPLKAYLKERFTSWFRSFHFSSKKETTNQKHDEASVAQLSIAHTDWHQQDNIDTEGDADSEYEADQRIYDDNNLTSISKSQKQKQLPPAFRYDSETALPAFEGAGIESNTAILVPTEIWSLFVPAPRPQ